MYDDASQLLRSEHDRETVLDGICRAQGAWGDVLQTIAESENDDDALRNLSERFSLTKMQATAVMDMQFRRLSRQNRSRLDDELSKTRSHIAELEARANPEA